MRRVPARRSLGRAPASPAGYFGSRMMLGAGRVAIAHDVDELLDDLDS